MLWYLGYGTRYLLIIMGHKLLIIDNKVENYQNTELKEWIAFNVMIVWLLACLVVSINNYCVVLYVINCCKIYIDYYIIIDNCV